MKKNPTYLFLKLAQRYSLSSIMSPIVKMLIIVGGGGYCNLNNVSLDKGKSCICINRINKQYDLHIIVPVYNVEKYVDKCLMSILNQKTSYSYFVTVINDGSTDCTSELLSKYLNEKNMEVITQKNQGLSAARNTGLKLIKGRYVMFVDSDDYLQDNAVELLMNCAMKEHADIVQGGWFEFSQDKLLSTHVLPYKRETDILPGFAWGKVFKAELFEHISFPIGYWFEDIVIFMIIYDIATNMWSIDSVIYGYRINQKGITSTAFGNIKSLDALYATKQMMADRVSLGLDFTNKTYEKFLNQVKYNFNKTLSINSKDVWYSVFCETVEIYKRYFKGCTAPEAFFKLDSALRHNSYSEYITALIQ